MEILNININNLDDALAYIQVLITSAIKIFDF